jgi:hypothetical protein
VMELKELIPGAFGIPDWNVAMAGTLVIILPPLAVAILMPSAAWWSTSSSRASAAAPWCSRTTRSIPT